MDAIADHFGVEVGRNPALNELKKDVAPMPVLDEMRERQEREKADPNHQLDATVRPGGDEDYMLLVKNPRKVDKLSQLTVMMRANGDLFTLLLKGRAHLALWPSTQSAFHYKARNPELLVFSPTLVASPFGQESLATLRREDLGLYLLTNTERAHLGDGRKISWEEIRTCLPASSLSNKEQTGLIAW